MAKATVYLRTALFTYGGADGHVPQGVCAVEGDIENDDRGGLAVKATRFRDERGRVIGEKPQSLLLPWAKIDHLLLHD